MNSQCDESVFGVAGKIVDVSTSGARIEATEPIGNVGMLLRLRANFRWGIWCVCCRLTALFAQKNP